MKAILKWLCEMRITNRFLKDFLSCEYKCFKTHIEGIEKKSEYEKLFGKLLRVQKQSFQSSFKTLRKIEFDVHYSNLIIDVIIDGLEIVNKNKVVPILISHKEKVSNHERQLLTLLAYYIHSQYKLDIETCKIIYGKAFKQITYSYRSSITKLKRVITRIEKQITSSESPITFRNSHCKVCGFEEECIKKLKERDDLSLIETLKPTELINRYNKGIFSAKQFSYTFKPKKIAYKNKRSFSELKALAIRENKTFILDTPKLPTDEVEVFLDIEGIPDREFNYLIGLIVKSNGKQVSYSFWAENEDEEEKIFIELILVLESIQSFKLYHYGSYEIRALRKIEKKLALCYKGSVERIRNSSFNLLEIFHTNVYPPTYSNSLKEIARFIGFKWTDAEASGINSIIWRYDWENTKKEEYKAKLILYNQEDCIALIKLKEWILNIPVEEDQYFQKAKNFKVDSMYKWGNIDFQNKQLEEINKFAYFNYQRTKVFVKSHPELIKRKPAKRCGSQLKIKPNKIIELNTPNTCAYCDSKELYRHDKQQRQTIDLKLSKTGLKRFVTLYHIGRFRCKSCNKVFTPENYKKIPQFGRTLDCWIINQIIYYRISFFKVSEALKESFDIHLFRGSILIIKARYAKEYIITAKEILKSIIESPIVHIDETTFQVGSQKGYVWVFTNMNSVYYTFRSTRESEFLNELMEGFKGVLISDFYAGYDSLPVPKQRCLIHLIRDLNDDLVKNQWNEEFKTLTNDFSNLLNSIIETVNKYGLKKRNLNKHNMSVTSFFIRVKNTKFETEPGNKWKKRLLSNRDELFTFLNFDGIPWNNNNAETAIKAVALLRRDIEGLPTENSIQDYLTLLSIQQTCKYRDLNFLNFLLSGEKSMLDYNERKRIDL